MFAGALFPMSGRFPLEQIAGLMPSRWGFAATASTVDLHAVNPLAEADFSWKHSSGQWLLDMGLLIGSESSPPPHCAGDCDGRRAGISRR